MRLHLAPHGSFEVEFVFETGVYSVLGDGDQTSSVLILLDDGRVAEECLVQIEVGGGSVFFDLFADVLQGQRSGFHAEMG